MNNNDVIIKYLNSNPDTDSKQWKSQSMSYEKGILYSYSTPIGVRFKHRGEEYLAVTRESYSCTTSRHINTLLGEAWRGYDRSHIIRKRNLTSYVVKGVPRDEALNWEMARSDLQDEVKRIQAFDVLDFVHSWRREYWERTTVELHEVNRFIDCSKELSDMYTLYLNFDTADKIEALNERLKQKNKDKAKERKEKMQQAILNSPDIVLDLFMCSDASSYIKPEFLTKLRKEHEAFGDVLRFDRYKFEDEVERMIGVNPRFMRDVNGRGLHDVRLIFYKANWKMFEFDLQDLVDAYDVEADSFPLNFKAGYNYSYRREGIQESNVNVTPLDWTITIGNSASQTITHIPRDFMELINGTVKLLKSLEEKDAIKGNPLR